jgi:hypothetical protein
MIEMTFKEFYESDGIQDDEIDYELYLIKNGTGDILYIGITSRSAWGRWFEYGWHMPSGVDEYFYSLVGRKIFYNFPDAWKWKIQLWTRHDCKEFCGSSNNRMAMLESEMICKLHPILNKTYNQYPSKDTTPRSQKEIDIDKEVRAGFDLAFNKHPKD